MILFTASSDWDRFLSRIQELRRLEDLSDFQRFEVGGGIVGLDTSEEAVIDFEPEELSSIEETIGEFKAALIEYENVSCRDAFLQHTIPGLLGVVDTNYDSIVLYSEMLQWILDHPGTHFREHVQ
ncbi:hypothetical protein GCM10010277_60480 [Streptomyces longisporoflavus]|nr:hypothetical protein GCM10010277_60480 [Streptomyces longisporoflavus]